MDERSGLSGCQVAGIVLAVLLVATVCLVTGMSICSQRDIHEISESHPSDHTGGIR